MASRTGLTNRRPTGRTCVAAGRVRWPGLPEQVSALVAVADGVEDTAALLPAEWQTFTSRVQLTAGKDTSLVWRETANEDLCLAVACGCWVAEYCQRRLAIGF
jgi:hypothetical protein